MISRHMKLVMINSSNLCNVNVDDDMLNCLLIDTSC